MKRIRALAAIAAVAAGLTVASADTIETPDALVVDAMDAPAHVSYAATVEMIRIGQSGSQASVLHVEHRAPDRTRTQYTAPSELNGDSVISIGDKSYAIDAKRKRIVASQNAAIDDPTILAANYILLRQNYHATERASETRAGRTADVLALVDDYTHKTVATVSIDRATKLVLDKQVYGTDGTPVSEMRVLQIRYDSAIPDSDFTIPSGYTTIDGAQHGAASQAIASLESKSGFEARCPMQLEHGFTAVEGKLVTMQGVKTLHVLFSDGLRTVSLFETGSGASVDLDRYKPQATMVGAQRAQYAAEGPTTMLVWSDGTRRYTLLGDLPLTELQRMAAAI